MNFKSIISALIALIVIVSTTALAEDGKIIIRVKGKSPAVTTMTGTDENLARQNIQPDKSETNSVSGTGAKILIRVKSPTTSTFQPATVSAPQPAPTVNVTVNVNQEKPRKPSFWKRLWYGSGVHASASIDIGTGMPYEYPPYWQINSVYAERANYEDTMRLYTGPAIHYGYGYGYRYSGNHGSELSGHPPYYGGTGPSHHGGHRGLYRYD